LAEVGRTGRAGEAPDEASDAVERRRDDLGRDDAHEQAALGL
jgi:hypothetical protein